MRLTSLLELWCACLVVAFLWTVGRVALKLRALDLGRMDLVRHVELARSWLPPEAAAALGTVRPAGMQSLGVLSVMPSAVAQVIAEIWVDETGTILGQVVWGRSSQTGRQVLHVSVLTYVGDPAEARHVATTDSVAGLTGGQRNGCRETRLPGRPVDELVSVHRQQLASTPERPLRFPEMRAVANVLDHSTQRWFAWCLDSGRLKAADDGRVTLSRRTCALLIGRRLTAPVHRRYVLARGRAQVRRFQAMPAPRP